MVFSPSLAPKVDMNLKTIRESLVRRLSVNYISYMGQEVQAHTISKDWCEGYFQAKKDAEQFLKQIEVFDHE